MAINRPTGDSDRKEAVRKRAQLRSKVGERTWTKRAKHRQIHGSEEGRPPGKIARAFDVRRRPASLEDRQRGSHKA
jgi:hypothetical protein